MDTSIDGPRPRRAGRMPLACALAMVAIAVSAGCGGDDSSSASDDPPARRVVQVEPIARDRWTYARERFNEMCAGCHSLDDAGARGRRFDLDRAGDIVESRARYAIAYGEPGMPRWDEALSRREFEELVRYVSSVDKNIQDGREDGWLWQIRLRMEGGHLRPEQIGGRPEQREQLEQEGR